MSVDSLAENCWACFSKLLFLPVFLLVYFLNNEISQWHKTCAQMRAIQSSIANVGLVLSSHTGPGRPGAVKRP